MDRAHNPVMNYEDYQKKYVANFINNLMPLDKNIDYTFEEKCDIITEFKMEEWLSIFRQYAKDNSLIEDVVYQMESFYYGRTRETNDIIVEIIMEVYHFNNNIKNIVNKQHIYKTTLGNFLYNNKNYHIHNLDYPLRLYELLDFLPYRPLL